jgi:tetratricopeptide (TPR) repeat protein
MTTAIFSIYFSVALATPNLNFATTALAAEDVPFKLNYSPVDFDYGKDIDLLFSELGKNQLNKRTVDSLAKYQQKSHSFSILNSTYDRLKLVQQINDQDSFYKNCAIVSKNVNTYTDSIADRLNISIDKYCRFLFLKRMTDLSPNINFSSRDLAYFKDAAPFFTTGENRPELVSFLRHYKTNPNEHDKVSNFLIEKYIEFRLRPATNVMTNLKVNVQFNKFLQNNLNLDDSSNSYFQEEFQRLSRDAQDSAEKGEITQAKLLIMSAANFYTRNKNFINQKKAWTGVILTGKALFYKGRDSDAIEIFNLAKSIVAKEDVSETNFYLIWPHIINKDFKAMRASIDKNGMEKTFEKFDSKLQFWIATAFIKTGDIKKGTAFLNKIIETSPYSFYSILSLKEIATLTKDAKESDVLAKLVSKNEPAEFSLEKTSNDLKDYIKILSVFNKI